MAGESAEKLARQQRERAERLLRSAQRYERGAAGERATGVILDALRQEGWAVFHDVKWPGRPRANIDHVVVGPPGVYVIDSKNWTGRIEVRDNTFRCNDRMRDRTVASAGDAALAVAGLLSAPAPAVTRSVLCFVRDESVAGWCHDVMLCSTANLREMLHTRPTALTPDQIRIAATELDIQFRDAVPPTLVSPVVRPKEALQPNRRAGPMSAPARPARTPHRRGKRSARGELISFGVFLILALVLLTQLPRLASVGDDVAKAFVPRPTTSYESCAALRKDHPDGVGTALGVSEFKPKTNRPEVDVAVYNANSSLDKDHDGIACERDRKVR